MPERLGVGGELSSCMGVSEGDKNWTWQNSPPVLPQGVDGEDHPSDGSSVPVAVLVLFSLFRTTCYSVTTDCTSWYDDDCFYYHSWRNNVVIAFGTLSSFLT